MSDLQKRFIDAAVETTWDDPSNAPHEVLLILGEAFKEALDWTDALVGFIGVDGDGYVCLLPEDSSRWPEPMETFDDANRYKLIRVDDE